MARHFRLDSVMAGQLRIPRRRRVSQAQAMPGSPLRFLPGESGPIWRLSFVLWKRTPPHRIPQYKRSDRL